MRGKLRRKLHLALMLTVKRTVLCFQPRHAACNPASSLSESINDVRNLYSQQISPREDQEELVALSPALTREVLSEGFLPNI